FCFTHSPCPLLYTLSLHDALPILRRHRRIAHRMLNVLVPEIILNGSGIMSARCEVIAARMPQLVGMADKRQPSHLARARHDRAKDRKSTRLNSSHRTISYAVFCLK